MPSTKIASNLTEFKELATQFAQTCNAGDIVFLQGPMGAGKTTFVRFVGEYFNVDDVSSPSFSLVNEYETTVPIIHIDLYRCNSEKEIDLLDLDHYLSKETHIIFIEWAQKAPWLLNAYTKMIKFECGDGDIRKLKFFSKKKG